MCFNGVCPDRNKANDVCFPRMFRVVPETVLRIGVAAKSVRAFSMYQHAVEVGRV